jgi:hypothetical protein
LLPREAFAFVVGGGKLRLLRLLRPRGEFGRHRVGVVIASTLPWRAALVGAVSPVTFDGDEVGWGPIHVLPPLEEADGEELAWSSSAEAATCRAETEVLRAGIVELRTAHAAVAADLAWRLARSESSSATAAAWLEHHTNVDAVRRRLVEWTASARALRNATSALGGGLLLSLAAALVSGSFAALGVLAVLAPLSSIGIPVLYWRAHRRLHPRLGAERWVDAAVMAFYPAASLRAFQKLATGVTATFHPVTVARALDGGTVRDELCELALRDLDHPAADTHRGDPTRAELARRLRLDVVPPPRRAVADGAGADGYCPRCLDTYLRAEGKCSRCPRVTLLAPPSDRSSVDRIGS